MDFRFINQSDVCNGLYDSGYFSTDVQFVFSRVQSRRKIAQQSIIIKFLGLQPCVLQIALQ